MIFGVVFVVVAWGLALAFALLNRQLLKTNESLIRSNSRLRTENAKLAAANRELIAQYTGSVVSRIRREP